MSDKALRKVRVMRICPAPGYLEKFRKKHKLSGRPYAEQVRILQQECLFLPGGWAGCMEKLGFEVFDSLYDDFQLAAQWAEENNALECFYETNPLFDILKRQVLQFQPDIIAFWTGGFFKVDRYHRMQLRQLQKKPVLLTGLWGDEVPMGETYSSYFGDVDFIFAVNDTYRQHFEDEGIRAYTLPSGFDEIVAFDPQDKVQDLIFCGDTGYNKLDHINRYRVLRAVGAKSKLQIFAREPRAPRPSRRKAILSGLNALSRLPNFVLGGVDRFLSGGQSTRGTKIARAVKVARILQRTGVRAEGFFPSSKHPRQNFFNGKKPLRRELPGRVRPGPLETSAYYELLTSAKIVLNVHRDEEADYGNIRCFEATGVGSVLLTDHGESLKEFFDIEKEVVTFTDAADCLEKIAYLLANPDVMVRVGEAGRQRTLRDHTVMRRCEKLKPILLRELQRMTGTEARNRAFIYATYDTNRYPISYDIAFFVEAAEILRRYSGAQGTIVNILYPIDIQKLAGVSDESDRAVDHHGREFRLTHVCGQIARMFPGVTVNEVKNRDALLSAELSDVPLIPFPRGELPHHTEYYRMVNGNPNLVEGFRASRQALTYIEDWTSTFMDPAKRLICITVRAYAFDTQRNSDLEEWVKFIESLDANLYEVVIVPDTDQIATYNESLLADYRPFWPACFDVDLRYALYETAYLNLFVNNGPATAASLNSNIRYLTFKLVVEGVPHCTEDFIAWAGFPRRGTPSYATKLQKWVWEDDSFEVIQREFNGMVREIELTTRRFSRELVHMGEGAVRNGHASGRAGAGGVAPVVQNVARGLLESDGRPPPQRVQPSRIADLDKLLDGSKQT